MGRRLHIKTTVKEGQEMRRMRALVAKVARRRLLLSFLWMQRNAGCLTHSIKLLNQCCVNMEEISLTRARLQYLPQGLSLKPIFSISTIRRR